jgi:hypothetical protein
MNLFTYLFSIFALALGAFLGLLGNRLIAVQERSGWKWAFYIFGGLAIAFALIAMSYRAKANAWKTEEIIMMVLVVVAGAFIIWITRIFLEIKNVFSIAELNPIINRFTKLGDRNNIKLFGGDLNFFGNSTPEIDQNSQYMELRALNFNRVQILCEEPQSQHTKMRYGKILTDIAHVELRFYEPQTADLRVRGRLIKVNGVDKLLMYTKDKPGFYKALETDTANSNGALYNNIWELVWSLAVQPTLQERQSYIDIYTGGAP